MFISRLCACTLLYGHAAVLTRPKRLRTNKGNCGTNSEREQNICAASALFRALAKGRSETKTKTTTKKPILKSKTAQKRFHHTRKRTLINAFLTYVSERCCPGVGTVWNTHYTTRLDAACFVLDGVGIDNCIRHLPYPFERETKKKTTTCSLAWMLECLEMPACCCFEIIPASN